MSSTLHDHPHDHAHDHALGHGHHHGHGGHGHAHGPADYGRAFAIGTALNVAFVVVEAGFGLRVHSMALLADAGHNLSDVLGLVLAWAGTVLARRIPTRRRTYGLRSTTILAALANAVFLLVAVGGVAWEAVHRFANPEPVVGGVVALVALVGLVVNGATALLFMSGRSHDLNVRGAFLHMAADAAVSAGVVVAGLVIGATGWLWLDPALSLAIVVVIAIGTWGLLRDSLDLALHAVPSHIDPQAVGAYLEALPGVSAVHDLHIWGMSTTDVALTAHLVRPVPEGEEEDDDAFLLRASRELRTRFGIAHPTLQIERGRGPHSCDLLPCVGV
ncbi:cation diffusion facilitator family transporter [Gemmatirosa kalamazoonensis]|uniref:Cation diffusion facilitator family transporter n=1 Tax=Gemmatirosa kalamazoonensis TaxID=861299 RepID=W0RC44_9BACT|nr:cation diffusion facilitator family transporter [Gemmatirosa kalamazoonensis]AHG88674.1 cation diffusion facilitator family transporter [Gemmatirosa kalamazoonensis]